MISDDGLTHIDYHALPIEDKDKYDNLACELVVSSLIIKNCKSSCAHTYLKKNCFVGVQNYPSTIAAMVVLITSFGANSGRTSGGGGEKDANKPNTIVSMHLTNDNNDDSDDSDDDDESVESFEPDDSNNGRTNSNNSLL